MVLKEHRVYVKYRRGVKRRLFAEQPSTLYRNDTDEPQYTNISFDITPEYTHDYVTFTYLGREFTITVKEFKKELKSFEFNFYYENKNYIKGTKHNGKL